MKRVTFNKKLIDVKPITALWLIGVIFGNPFYNLVAYLFVTGQELYVETSTNVTQINVPIYVLYLVIIFVGRFAFHRWKFRSVLDTNIWFNLEVFSQRKAYQIIGMLTFFMWTGEVEGNIAGFIYFPMTILLSIILWVVNHKRLKSMETYITSNY